MTISTECRKDLI